MFKYADDDKHCDVCAENRMCDITTLYNVVVDADACCVDGMVDAAFLATIRSRVYSRKYC
jgi:hypothetical protein